MSKKQLDKELEQTATELIKAINFGDASFLPTTNMKVTTEYFDDPNDKISKVGAICSQNFLLNYEDTSGHQCVDMVAHVKFDKSLQPYDVYCVRRSTGNVLFELDVEKFNIEKNAKILEGELKDKTPKKVNKIKI